MHPSMLRLSTAMFSERTKEIEQRKKEKLINNMRSTESPRYWVTSARPANFGDSLEIPAKPDNWFDDNRVWNEEDCDYKIRRTKLDVMENVKSGCCLLIVLLAGRTLFELWLKKHKYYVVDTYEEYDISNLKPGEVVVSKYLGEPVCFRLLTRKEIEETIRLDKKEQYDNESYVATTPVKEYQLLVVSAKTNKGTIPEPLKGKYKGWYCPKTGQIFDKLGRIRKDGKGGKNLQYLNHTLHDNIVCLNQKMDYYSNYSLYLI